MEELTKEQECALIDLAIIIAENNKKEQEAIKGYTEQLKYVQNAKSLFPVYSEMWRKLSELEAATVEKTQDELSHSRDLNFEYTGITDISPKED